MFGVIFSSVGRDIILGIVLLSLLAGGYLYYVHVEARIAALSANLTLVSQQADDLITARAKFESDVRSIAKAQIAANQLIILAQTTADQASHKLRMTPLSRDQATINRNFTDALQGIADASK